MDKSFRPLVSIVMPVYNGSNYMRDAIDSALGQTYSNIEVIVVNDGSTDNTSEVAKSYGTSIRYIEKENGGVASALNLAIRVALGLYISWLSHDDIYASNKIEHQINRLSELGLAERKNTILWSNISHIDEAGNTLLIREYQKKHEIDKLNMSLYPVLRGLIHGCTLLIPKQCFQLHGEFDDTLMVTQDYELWFRMFPACNLIFMEDVFVKYRRHSNQGSKLSDPASEELSNLWIHMLSSLSKKEKKEVDGSLLTFYQKTLPVVSRAKYKKAKKYVQREIRFYSSNIVLRALILIKRKLLK